MIKTPLSTVIGGALTVNSITAPDGTMTADPISLIVSVED